MVDLKLLEIFIWFGLYVDVILKLTPTVSLKGIDGSKSSENE